MYTAECKKFLTRETIYEMLDREEKYASGWGEGKQSHEQGFPDHVVDREIGLPFGVMDFVNFAEKYLDEAKLAHSNYLPDPKAVRIRLLKAASLLVSALQVHGVDTDLESIAGVSSTKFPIFHGGLKAFREAKSSKPQL